MPIIYELRGKPAEYSELGLNLYSGCAVGCRYCTKPWLYRMTWEKWTTGAQPQKNILFQLKRDAKRMQGDPREIQVGPSADPYQSDEAARLTRKALLILEQYRLRVQVLTLCGLRSVVDFDIFARNRWKYATQIFFLSEKLREEWEPGAAPIAERIQALREAHAAGISTWVQTGPAAYPAELIEVVESLRDDVDAWIIHKPPPGEPRPQMKAGYRPGFVDADTALAYLRHADEKGLGEKLHNIMEEMKTKIWVPDEEDKGRSGEPG